MKEKKELTVVKAVVLLIVLYTIFTWVFSRVFSLLAEGLASFLTFQISTIIPMILAVVISILLMCLSWKISVFLTFRNKNHDGLDVKKVAIIIVIILAIMSVITMIYDIYLMNESIEQQYSNDFLEDRDVVAAFTPEELQERANQNDENKEEIKKQTYPLIIMQNILSLGINLLIFSLVPKKMMAKYDGIAEIEKNVSKSE